MLILCSQKTLWRVFPNVSHPIWASKRVCFKFQKRYSISVDNKEEAACVPHMAKWSENIRDRDKMHVCLCPMTQGAMQFPYAKMPRDVYLNILGEWTESKTIILICCCSLINHSLLWLTESIHTHIVIIALWSQEEPSYMAFIDLASYRIVSVQYKCHAIVQTIMICLVNLMKLRL